MENLDPTTIHILTFILGAACLHGLWLAIVILLKNYRDTNHWLLSTALIAISLYLLNYILFLTGIILIYPHLLGVFFPPVILIGPCFYFFAKKNSDPRFRWKFRHLLHLLPMLMAMISIMPTLKASREKKLAIIEWLMNPDASFTWADVLQGNYYMYLLIAYIGFALWVISAAQQKEESAETAFHLEWLTGFLKLFMLILWLDLAIKFSFFALRVPAFTLEFLIATIIAITIQISGYQVIDKLPHFSIRLPFSMNEKYKTSSLTPSQMAIYAQRLQTLLDKEKPYLDAQLKVAELADMLEIPSHQLSQILNEGMQTNFNDLINHYRITEIKQRLLSPAFSHYAILAIAFDCGFQNKTTFNRVFKKMTGKTPSEFTKNQTV